MINSTLTLNLLKIFLAISFHNVYNWQLLWCWRYFSPFFCLCTLLCFAVPISNTFQDQMPFATQFFLRKESNFIRGHRFVSGRWLAEQQIFYFQSKIQLTNSSPRKCKACEWTIKGVLWNPRIRNNWSKDIFCASIRETRITSNFEPRNLPQPQKSRLSSDSHKNVATKITF